MNVYEIITDRIIGMLEKGVVPWHKPWNGGANAPKNLVSGKEYRGINVFLLSSSGYASPYWASYKQIAAMGGQVTKGEKGTPVVFWNWIEAEKSALGKADRIPFIRYYTVFNVQQTTGLDGKIPPSDAVVNPFSPIESAEAIASRFTDCPVEHSGNRAFYSPTRDMIGMPSPELFNSPEEYYSTLFHEMTHSTGHKSRLDRPGFIDVNFGSQSYSKEELVAEMGATFLSAVSGIENKMIDNSAAYINGWLSKLRKDKKILISAASLAQKATDHILGK